MKVTALIPDELIEDIKKLSNSDTITNALITALEEWRNLKKIKSLNMTVKKEPLQFIQSSSEVRSTNRKR